MNAWHLDDDIIQRYRTGGADLALAGSVEAHLLTCATCRLLVGAAVPAERLAMIWRNIEAGMDAPQPSLLRRIAARLRLTGVVLAMNNALANAGRPLSVAIGLISAMVAMACTAVLLVIAGSVSSSSTGGSIRSEPAMAGKNFSPVAPLPPPQTADPATSAAAPVPGPLLTPKPLLTPGPPLTPEPLLTVGPAMTPGPPPVLTVADITTEARFWVAWSRSPEGDTTTGTDLDPCQLAALDRQAAPIVASPALYLTDMADIVPSFITVYANPNGPQRLDVYVIKVGCLDGTGNVLAAREDFPYIVGGGDRVEAML